MGKSGRDRLYSGEMSGNVSLPALVTSRRQHAAVRRQKEIMSTAGRHRDNAIWTCPNGCARSHTRIHIHDEFVS